MTQNDCATRLREARRALGFTQDQLAVRAGVTRQTIMALEEGRSVRSENLFAVCEQLGLQITLAPAVAKGRPTLKQLMREHRMRGD